MPVGNVEEGNKSQKAEASSANVVPVRLSLLCLLSYERLSRQARSKKASPLMSVVVVDNVMMPQRPRPRAEVCTTLLCPFSNSASKGR
jgi:hypothetical protein